MILQPKEPAKALGRRVRQQYLTLAKQITSDLEMNYPMLYQRFAENDWAAIQLDRAVAIAALKSGLLPKDIVCIIHQGPYIQHQVHVKKLSMLIMSQYARSTVLQAMMLVGKHQEQLDKRSPI